MTTEIKRLTNREVEDFIGLLNVYQEVFEGETYLLDPSHLQKLLNNDRFMVWVAKLENRVIGGLTVHILDRYDSVKPSAYIYDLGVLTEHQRKGIGKKLINSLREYCVQSDFEEMFVQAETEDTHAVNFYRSTPISDELPAIHFSYEFSIES
ncbi:MAG: GNAT family N-acetyltransferase [Bacteroidia bacterium]|nr:GNAT family N-acetyltransferase [Bacteroidia bacterium]